MAVSSTGGINTFSRYRQKLRYYEIEKGMHRYSNDTYHGFDQGGSAVYRFDVHNSFVLILSYDEAESGLSRCSL